MVRCTGYAIRLEDPAGPPAYHPRSDERTSTITLSRPCPTCSSHGPVCSFKKAPRQVQVSTSASRSPTVVRWTCYHGSRHWHPYAIELVDPCLGDPCCLPRSSETLELRSNPRPEPRSAHKRWKIFPVHYAQQGWYSHCNQPGRVRNHPSLRIYQIC